MRHLLQAFLFVLILHGAAFSQPPTPAPPKSGQNRQRHGQPKEEISHKDQQVSDRLSLAIETLTSEISKRKKEDDSKPQESESSADFFLKLSAIISAVATTALAILGFFQWRAMGQQRDAMTGQSGHMKEGLDLSKQTIEVMVQQIKIMEGQIDQAKYHGFGLAGRANSQPCSRPSVKWMPSPRALGLILITFKDGVVPTEFQQVERSMANCGVLVGAGGVLRSPFLLFTLCLDEDTCYGNGYYHGTCPAMLELESIQVLSHSASSQ